jgi:adenosylhomocysteine nucleosidase
VIAIFCAFGAEYGPLRARLRNVRELAIGDLRGCTGELGNVATTIIVSGVGLRRAAHSAAVALDNLPHIKSLLLTGVAGALHHDLRIGDIVLGERLILRREDEFVSEHEIEVELEQLQLLAGGLRRARVPHQRGAMLTSRRVIALAADKRRAHTSFGAIAVDMESAVIAREAAARRIPFVAIRAILDTADQDLEGAMLADENGRVRPFFAARALARNPRLIGASIRLMRNLRIASSAMAMAVEAALTSAARDNAPIRD